MNRSEFRIVLGFVSNSSDGDLSVTFGLVYDIVDSNQTIIMKYQSVTIPRKINFSFYFELKFSHFTISQPFYNQFNVINS